MVADYHLTGNVMTSNQRDFQQISELSLGLTQSEVRRIINRLPLSDSLAALDFMLRELWEGKEYSCLKTT